MHPLMKVIEGICPVCDTPLTECPAKGCERSKCPNYNSHSYPDRWDPAIEAHAGSSHWWIQNNVVIGCCMCGTVEATTGNQAIPVPQRVHVHEE